MAIDFNKCRQTNSGNIITAKGRLLYPNVFKPTVMKGETDLTKAKYGLSLIFTNDADLSILKKAVEEKAISEWGPDYKTKFKVKQPFLPMSDQPRLLALAEQFPVLIRTSSKDRPGVVDASNNRVDEDKADQVYSGRWAVISVRPYTYNHATGGRGVSLGLQNIQLLDNDEPLAGARIQAQDEFEAVGGSEAKPTSSLFD